MAKETQLVLAFYGSEDGAASAARALEQWARANKGARVGAIAVVVEDDRGRLKTHRLGSHEARKGMGLGAVVGIVAAVVSGGTLVQGLVLGGATGGLAGSFYRRGVGLDEDRSSRLRARLEPGQAAVAVVAPATQAEAISGRLVELGGRAEVEDAGRNEQPAEQEPAPAGA